MTIFETSLVLYLISAMIQVESSGNDTAMNLNEGAFGCLQIRQIYLDEIERVTDKKYDIQQMMQRHYAIEATYAYFLIVAKQIEEKEGREVTLEDLARCHNGGNNGYKKESTLNYWNKVRKEYNDLTEFIDLP